MINEVLISPLSFNFYIAIVFQLFWSVPSSSLHFLHGKVYNFCCLNAHLKRSFFGNKKLNREHVMSGSISCLGH